MFEFAPPTPEELAERGVVETPVNQPEQPEAEIPVKVSKPKGKTK